MLPTHEAAHRGPRERTGNENMGLVAASRELREAAVVGFEQHPYM